MVMTTSLTALLLLSSSLPLPTRNPLSLPIVTPKKRWNTRQLPQRECLVMLNAQDRERDLSYLNRPHEGRQTCQISITVNIHSTPREVQSST
jgi:hypothetical protein